MKREISRRMFMQGCAGAAFASMVRMRAFAASALAQDTNRPQFHLLPAANWMNDPNGPIYWKGRYHMFCQYNPHAAVWGDMHWAHAVSEDMVHWQHLPVALAPTPGGPDADGCFTGSAVVFNGTPTLLYTGVKTVSAEEATLRDGRHNFRETQCLATSTDPELRTWTKLPEPVIPSPPPGLAITGFRDPCLWREGDTWYAGIGSGIRNKGGCVFVYRSRDLRKWEYVHPLISGEWNGKTGNDPVGSGEMWECPDFFALDGKHVLLYSTEGKVFWTVGDYDARQQRFTPQRKGQLDYGPHAYYAPKTMLDEDGRRILWGWVPETRPESEYARAGWAGLMSLPRVLRVNAKGGLEMRVCQRVQELRGGDPIQPEKSEDRTTWPLKDLAAELAFWVRPSRGTVHLSIGSEGAPAVDFHFDATHGIVSYNGAPLDAAPDPGEMRISLYLDGSVLEIVVNERLAHTSRIYDLHPQNTVLTMTDPGEAVADAFLWRMRAISPDRLTV